MAELPTSPDLGGRVAIVTGAGRGMGRAEAIVLARYGAAVVVNDLPHQEGGPAAAVVAEIRAGGGRAVLAEASVDSFAAGEFLVARAVEEFGRLDILVNTAGTFRMGPIPDLSESDWDAVIDVNLKGTFATIRAALPEFRAQGDGVIVNKSSDAGLGDFYNAVYGASKEGIVGLTRAVAREFGRYGVRCNAIRPRAFDTGMANEVAWKRQTNFDATFGVPACGTHHYTPRLGTAMEVAEVVAWLCTEKARNVNGRVLAAGCGEVGLWSESTVTRSSFAPDGLTFADVDVAASHVFADLDDPYATLPDEAYRLMDERIRSQRARLRELDASS